jgi:hypothetical protein
MPVIEAVIEPIVVAREPHGIVTECAPPVEPVVAAHGETATAVAEGEITIGTGAHCKIAAAAVAQGEVTTATGAHGKIAAATAGTDGEIAAATAAHAATYMATATAHAASAMTSTSASASASTSAAHQCEEIAIAIAGSKRGLWACDLRGSWKCAGNNQRRSERSGRQAAGNDVTHDVVLSTNIGRGPVPDDRKSPCSKTYGLPAKFRKGEVMQNEISVMRAGLLRCRAALADAPLGDYGQACARPS